MPRKRQLTRLSANLRYMRGQNQFTQQFLADLLECSRYAVCKYEAGHRTPSTMQLRKLAHVYKTTMDSLVNDDLSGIFTRGENDEE